MLDFKVEISALPSCKDDFVRWLDAQAALLRSGQFARRDIGNLPEELNGMSRHERHALKSRLVVLIHRLLKCQFQPGRKNSELDRQDHRATREKSNEIAIPVIARSS